MFKFEDYLDPILKSERYKNHDFLKKKMGDSIVFYKTGINISKINFDLAIIGVPESRKSDNFGAEKAPLTIREKLYSLSIPCIDLKIIDLGDFKQGFTHNDTIIGLTELLYFILKQGIIPIIIGGTQELTYANYAAYQQLEQSVSICSIDSCFDLGNSDLRFDNKSYISKILLHENKYLLNFSTIGYQTYFTSDDEIKLIDDLGFERYRLGEIRSDLKQIEPVIRDSDIVSIDIGSVKFSDSPGNKQASPNGLYGQDICQIARFSGMSDKVSSFGLYEINPEFDINNQTSFLAAEIIWHFIEGFYFRENDFPFCDLTKYTKFVLANNSIEEALVFYKSSKSGRWWLEIPAIKTKLKKKTILACTEADYIEASKDKLPERFMRFLNFNN